MNGIYDGEKCRSRMTEIVFLALTAWREASGESMEARTGVIFSILNRVQKPKWWGYDVLSVVKQKEQYTGLTHPGDPNLTRWPSSDEKSWRECLKVAKLAFDGEIINPVPGADSYHDISIDPPYWARPEMFVRQIGQLKFYDVDQDYERIAIICTGANII